MKDILLVETCEKCGKQLTLMESINMDTNALMLVKRCLNCYNRPVEEVIEVYPSDRVKIKIAALYEQNIKLV